MLTRLVQFLLTGKKLELPELLPDFDISPEYSEKKFTETMPVPVKKPKPDVTQIKAQKRILLSHENLKNFMSVIIEDDINVEKPFAGICEATGKIHRFNPERLTIYDETTN